MELSEEFKKGLYDNFRWKHTNISNLDQPVLIILDYSPTSESVPFSFAFNLDGESRCWISHNKVKTVGGNNSLPTLYEAYKEFCYEGTKFYPYSIVAIEDTVFSNIAEFKGVCERLYAHIDQK